MEQPIFRQQRREVDQVAMLMRPKRDLSGPDFKRVNYANLQLMQRENRRQRDEVQPVHIPFKLKRFTKVEAVVMRDPSEVRHSRSYFKEPPLLSVSPTRTKDFVYSNAVSAITAQPRYAPVYIKPNARSLNPSYGRVPKYLASIKSELEHRRVEVERQVEAAKVPYGMRLIPEEERLQTLEALSRKRSEVLAMIARLPLALVTHASIRRRNDYEKQIEELESSIATFSRPKVYLQAS